ncbi:DUF4846 domain-containing protein [Niabella hibiscisoli]|uniref:DUF4846 domain-containing protein n=1 Tax=Niabella hibiscisoli TaxID=1825928 RepID=UPI0021D456DC|nr:DUF4846 domain-containing protein [Niabella hibiscisoli]
MKIYLITMLFWVGCEQASVRSAVREYPAESASNIDAFRSVGAIREPAGSKRIDCKEGSFGHWLRKVTLKSGNEVFLFNGRLKPNQQAQYAVMDISVGKRDLQQCADAVMRLRAEFLFDQKRFSDIVFADNLGKNIPGPEVTIKVVFLNT